MSEPDADAFVLRGYSSLTRSGFALPCYASGDGLNTWYLAVCSRPGDHRGTVAGWETFTDDHIQALPVELRRVIRLGDPWTDIFLDDGRPMVGTPVEILGSTPATLERIAETAPLSALDLALAADAEDASKWLAAARSYVERRHGPGQAPKWLEATVLAPQVRLRIRRALPGDLVREPIGQLSDIIIRTRGTGFEISLSAGVRKMLARSGLETQMRGEIAALCDRLGLPVRIVLPLSADEALGKQLAPHLPFLRRYARALTGSQEDGDRLVRATLETIVATPEAFRRDIEPRLEFYKLLNTIASREPGGAVEPDGSNGAERDGFVPPRKIASEPRQALLLTAMERFTVEDAAYLLDTSPVEVEALIKKAVAEIENQTRTRVLIIEDEPLIAMDLETIVNDMGHSVTGVAVTRDEAVALAKEEPPGLILADIQLADDSSGIDAVMDILETLQVPVIFVTAFPERLLTGERPEPTFLISKPFQRETVKTTIAQALFFDQASVPAG